MSASRTVAALIAAWQARDAEAAGDCFAEDAVWHNLPYPPIAGRDAIVAATAVFLADMISAEFTIRQQGEVAPGVLMNERIDRFTTSDGRTITIPVTGVFEVAGGLIRSWRDYFDREAMTPHG